MTSTPSRTWRGATARQWVADPLWVVWLLGAVGVTLAVAGLILGPPGWLTWSLMAVAAAVAALALSGST